MRVLPFLTHWREEFAQFKNTIQSTRNYGSRISLAWCDGSEWNCVRTYDWRASTLQI
jgi:hypothetical protein